MGNSEDMLKGLLENGNIPDNIKDIIGNLKNGNSDGIDKEMLSNLAGMLNQNNNTQGNNESKTNENENSIDMETLLKIKKIMDKIGNNKNDPRSNLLKSLKPYLKEGKQEKVEQYIKMLNMTQVVDVLKPDGGEKKK